jgi:hypothetical protein
VDTLGGRRSFVKIFKDREQSCEPSEEQANHEFSSVEASYDLFRRNRSSDRSRSARARLLTP